MNRKYIIVADDSINGFDEEIAKLEREWGAEEIEPSEDCVSRKSIVNKINILQDELTSNDDSKWNRNKLAFKYMAYVNGIILNEPSVYPERPKGKWKRIAGFEDCNYDKCSICGVYQLFYYGKPSTNYCPNCGAEMSGGGEDD